ETICRSGTHVEFPDGVPAKIIGNRLFRDRHLIRAEYARVIRRAERFVLIANAFFVPDRRIRRALTRAVRRGVRVEVMVPERSDVPAATYAGRAIYARLLKNGIRIFLWPKKMLHAKTAVVDGIWSTVGSYNMNHRSLFHDLEATAIILDRKFGAAMVETFEADKRICRELSLREWEARPWGERVVERLCYLIRYWL
ncbi:MAG: phospholipase D-like domain-containing protein, partial [Planctomycetota bacterium]|nr:phospholipase D-like domain-containing protein [Planctomycetota bacterium]